MRRFKKFLGFLIPILIVFAGACVVYYFAFTDAYLKIPAKADLTGSEFIGNWAEIGGDGRTGAALNLAGNGRALIKKDGRAESIGTWKESGGGVEFTPLVETSKFTVESFGRENSLSGKTPDSLGYAGDFFLINRKVAYAKTSDELVYDMEARDEAIQDLKDNYDILTSDESWDFSRVNDLKEQWHEFWAGFKELIKSFTDK